MPENLVNPQKLQKGKYPDKKVRTCSRNIPYNDRYRGQNSSLNT